MHKRKNLIFTGIFIILVNTFLGVPSLYAQRGGGGSNSDWQSWGKVTNGPSTSNNNNRSYTYTTPQQPTVQPKPRALPDNAYPSNNFNPNIGKQEFRPYKSSEQGKTQGRVHIEIIGERHDGKDNGDKEFPAAMSAPGDKRIVFIEGAKAGEWVEDPSLETVKKVVDVAGLEEDKTYKQTIDAASKAVQAEKEWIAAADKAKILAQKSAELWKEYAALQAFKTETEVKWLTASEEYLQIGDRWNDMQAPAKLDYETTLAKYTTEVSAFNEVTNKHKLEVLENNALLKTTTEKFKTAESFYNQAQKQREEKWVETIAAAKGMNYDTVILIVGAGHGANQFGLLDKLDKQGYSWTSLMPKDLDLSRYNK